MPRLVFDSYMTPSHYVAALLGEIAPYGRVFEPCVGDGAISDVLAALPSVREVVTNDIDRKRPATLHNDATKDFAWFSTEWDWVITNPPFSSELPILEHALDHSENVAFLARLSFLEPCEDREFLLGSRPPTQVIVLPRYSFRHNDEGKPQTDNVTCCWMVWHRDKEPRGFKAYSRARAEALAIMQGLIDG